MVEFEYTLEFDNHTIQATVQAEAHIFEENYGADADGNRGEIRTFMDDLEVWVFDQKGNDISDKIQNKYKYLWTAIEEEAETVLMEAYND